MDRKKGLEKAAEDLAAVLERHFNSLPADERKLKRAALEGAVAKIGTPAKSAAPPRTRASRRAGRRPE